ncbi:MAG: DMT family transporter [Desulfobacterales bacterium]|nr:MAG: DMT family transporter [Desulfobacterales bacterium]
MGKLTQADTNWEPWYKNMANPELLALIWGLAAAVSWGSGDFSGGFATKSGSVLGVLFVGYLVSVFLLSFFALWFGSPTLHVFSFAAAALAGVTGIIGLAALYKGLAGGQMGIVAPLAALTTAALPVVVGIILEGMPPILHIMGFFIASAAIWLLSVPEKSQSFQWRQISLPIAAGVFLGLSLIFIDQAAEHSVLWSLVVARIAAIAVLMAMLLIFRKGSMPPKRNYPIVFLAGIFDTGGYTFYALAASTGRLDTSAVLACMYPATTFILAWLLLKERLSGRQWIGVIAAFIAIILIAA